MKTHLIEGHEVTFTRTPLPGTGNAYEVTADGTFIGYVVGRDGGWSYQPEPTRSTPVRASYDFAFAQPSRRYVTESLIAEAKMAGVLS